MEKGCAATYTPFLSRECHENLQCCFFAGDYRRQAGPWFSKMQLSACGCQLLLPVKPCLFIEEQDKGKATVASRASQKKQGVDVLKKEYLEDPQATLALRSCNTRMLDAGRAVAEW